MKTILIIEDNPDVRMSAHIVLQCHGLQCIEADHPARAKSLLSQHEISLVLLDMNFTHDTTSGKEGLQFLTWMKHNHFTLPVIIITAWAKIELAVEAMQLGACDLIEKPWDNKRLINTVKRYLPNKQQIAAPNSDYIYASTAMERLLQTAKKVAKTDANVLILGESGSGKSLLAHFLHTHSSRSEHNLTSVNMAALPAELFESELFGHCKGAFTDAKEHRIGRFKLAGNGTLFLDEIGSLPLPLQAKLLRVLETGEYEVLGRSDTELNRARIISATNSNLFEAVRKGNFRQDLLYRLNTIILTIPPLRERPEDIPILANYFVHKHVERHCTSQLGQISTHPITLSTTAMHKLTRHCWPGNVRELSHVIERAVILSEGGAIDDEYIQFEQTIREPITPLMSLEEAEKRIIENAIQHFSGNVNAAGEFLGLSKSAIYRRLEKHGISLKASEHG